MDTNTKKNKKILGVIGGLGPMASAYFVRLVTEMTKADTDQEHIEIIMHSCPQIPDRTAYILDRSKENPFDKLAEVGKRLADYGADIIAMPCITAHFFQADLVEKVGVPIINAIDETSAYLKARGIHDVGIMATNGTVKSGIFERSLAEYGIRAHIPSDEMQQKVMHIIYDSVKAGKPINQDMVRAVKAHLNEKGSQVILLGCTELSMIKRDLSMHEGFFDVMEMLAQVAVKSCGELKDEWTELI